MTQCVDGFLCNQGLAADSTLLALGQAGSSTGSSLARDNFFGVTQSCNLFLCYSGLATDSTLLALGQAGLGAGCVLAGNDFFGVAQCCDFFLGNQDLVTDGALLALGQAGLGAGCCLAGDNFFGVTQSCDFFNGLADDLAALAGHGNGLGSGLGAGCILGNQLSSSGVGMLTLHNSLGLDLNIILGCVDLSKGSRRIGGYTPYTLPARIFRQINQIGMAVCCIRLRCCIDQFQSTAGHFQRFCTGFAGAGGISPQAVVTAAALHIAAGYQNAGAAAQRLHILGSNGNITAVDDDHTAGADSFDSRAILDSGAVHSLHFQGATVDDHIAVCAGCLNDPVAGAIPTIAALIPGTLGILALPGGHLDITAVDDNIVICIAGLQQFIAAVAGPLGHREIQIGIHNDIAIGHGDTADAFGC